MKRIPQRSSVWTTAAIVALWLAGCTGLPLGMQAPSVTLADISVVNVGLFEQQFMLKLRVQNPNPQEFVIDGLAFDLEVNEQPFAKGVSNQLVTVPRFGSAVISADTMSTLGGVLRQFGRLAQGERPSFAYRIRGNLSISGSNVPFDRRGDFDQDRSDRHEHFVNS